jgi:hypothetical protein
MIVGADAHGVSEDPATLARIVERAKMRERDPPLSISVIISCKDPWNSHPVGNIADSIG